MSKYTDTISFVVFAILMLLGIYSCKAGPPFDVCDKYILYDGDVTIKKTETIRYRAWDHYIIKPVRYDVTIEEPGDYYFVGKIEPDHSGWNVPDYRYWHYNVDSVPFVTSMESRDRIREFKISRRGDEEFWDFRIKYHGHGLKRSFIEG